jgi:hypothetical protein
MYLWLSIVSFHPIIQRSIPSQFTVSVCHSGTLELTGLTTEIDFFLLLIYDVTWHSHLSSASTSTLMHAFMCHFVKKKIGGIRQAPLRCSIRTGYVF